MLIVCYRQLRNIRSLIHDWSMEFSNLAASSKQQTPLTAVVSVEWRTATYEVTQLQCGIKIISDFWTSTSLFFITAAFDFCTVNLVVTIHTNFRNCSFFTSYTNGKPAGVLEHCREGNTNCPPPHLWGRFLLTASVRRRRMSVYIL